MTRRQSDSQWSGDIAAQPALIIPCVKSAGKFLSSVSWDQDSILLTDYLPKGQTINAEYYSSLLVQLKGILKEKHRENFTKQLLILNDNALAHRALATQKKLAYLGFQCINHTPYSPSTAACSLD